MPLRIKIDFSLAEKNLAIRFQFFFLNIFYIKIILHDISFLSNDIIAKESCNEGKCLNERGGEEEEGEEDTELRAEENRAVKSDHYPSDVS